MLEAGFAEDWRGCSLPLEAGGGVEVVDDGGDMLGCGAGVRTVRTGVNVCL